jgi:hypothetical protein
VNKETWLEPTKDIVSLVRIDTAQKPKITTGESEVTADKTACGADRYPQLLKRIIYSAESSAEHALAHQIALSQMIEKLSCDRSAVNRPLIARLQIALQATRQGDLVTASVLMQDHGLGSKQELAPPISASERSSDSEFVRHQMG